MQDSASQTYNIPVPGLSDNPYLGVKRAKFALQNRDLLAIFEPIVNEILQLVNDQIQSTNSDVKAVLLVGGFGSSMYLKDRLKASISPRIEGLQPPKAWLAVVSGACMKGLAEASDELNMVAIKSRTARKHYGVELRLVYDESVHISIEHKK